MKAFSIVLSIATLILFWGCGNNIRNSYKARQTIDSINKPLNSSNTLKNKKNVIDTTEKRNQEDAWARSFILNNYLVSNAPSEATETVDSDCAIFVYPDSLQIEKMKNESNEEDFSVVVDDQQFYTGKAIELFDSLKVKIVTPGKRYIKFASETKSVYFDTRAKASEGWITILFRKDSLPRIISAIDLQVDSSLRGYFNKK